MSAPDGAGAAVWRGRALVTGAGGAVGRAVALRLASRGLDVVVAGREAYALRATAERAHAGGLEIRPVVCDLTDEHQVGGLVADHGPLRVLVTTTATAGSAPLEQSSLEDWRRQLDANATGAFLCVRAALPGMRALGTGRVVTVASVAALAGGHHAASDTAAQHAAVGLARAVASELAGTGVTCNAVCPGHVRGEMTDRTIATAMATTGRSRDEALAALLGRSPLGRLVEPDEVAAAVEFLCGDEAGAVNGHALVIDGGGLP